MGIWGFFGWCRFSLSYIKKLTTTSTTNSPNPQKSKFLRGFTMASRCPRARRRSRSGRSPLGFPRRPGPAGSPSDSAQRPRLRSATPKNQNPERFLKTTRNSEILQKTRKSTKNTTRFFLLNFWLVSFFCLFWCFGLMSFFAFLYTKLQKKRFVNDFLIILRMCDFF